MHAQAPARALLISLLATLGTAASWSFENAALSVRGKGAGVEGGSKQSFSVNQPPIAQAVALTPTDTLKITITTKEGSTEKKPNQAFLLLRDTSSGLEDAFPFSVKDNGKAKLDLTHKDVPIALLSKAAPIQASIVLGSFGSSTPLRQHVFDLLPTFEAGSPIPDAEKAERLLKKDEIHHIFKADPRSPPRIISLVFTLAVLAALPILAGTWLLLGANVDHLSGAIGQSPVAHSLFIGSVLAMEGVFFLYYTSWNLFQTLPVASIVAVVAYIAGSRALTEVQERRLAGKR